MCTHRPKIWQFNFFPLKFNISSFNLCRLHLYCCYYQRYLTVFNQWLNGSSQVGIRNKALGRNCWLKIQRFFFLQIQRFLKLTQKPFKIKHVPPLQTFVRNQLNFPNLWTVLFRELFILKKRWSFYIFLILNILVSRSFPKRRRSRGGDKNMILFSLDICFWL